MNKKFKHLAFVGRYLAVWAEPPADLEEQPNTLSFASDEPPTKKKKLKQKINK